ncbi:hypothetical protein [Neisseria chenwenguii]|uniref:Uncharacterized protein n=1 Tax=Neisseria chenwenguii TaxID=1853278 RepID=A0A220RZQ9_9NEIS|nr:hypothetical protein [Neisseria chenwenguii]ASK26677.1 hypothetical protein BG910_01985 [Neisseria chenwenguii]ROV56340.1 hypothetical protein EGS38_04795 [Neisseria chenwenguii]
MDIFLLAAAAYALVWLLLIFRAGMFQWFWGSILLWLAAGFWGAQLLPGIWGITAAGPLYVPHLYLTVASLFFFVNCWQKAPEGSYWLADEKHVAVGLFAVSNMLMTLAFFVLSAMVWYHYPTTTTAFALPAMLEFYALKPVYWFALQFVLMAVFYLHRTVIMEQPTHWFGLRQLKAGFLLALLCEAATVLAIMLEVNRT